MTVKELENMLQMRRANIRYYEQEQLIKPARRQNGYRDYSMRDVEELKKIKLLRELGISLADIKKLQTGELALQDEMQQQIRELGHRQKEAKDTQHICQAIMEEQVTYEQLCADKYLYGSACDQMEGDAAQVLVAENTAQVQMAGDTGRLQGQQQNGLDRNRQEDGGLETEPAAIPQYLEEDQPARIPPLNRYAARIFDLCLYYEIAVCMVSLFHLNYQLVFPLPQAAVSMLICLFAEPLCLHLTKTTAGKCIFGLYLEDRNGRRPAYLEAMIRTGKVFFYGMGFQIPLVQLYRLYKSYQAAAAGELPWEDSLEYVQKKSVRRRNCYVKLAAVWIVSFIFVYGCIVYAQIPKNKGELTLEQFVENYNQVARFFGSSTIHSRLKADGTFYTRKEIQELYEETNTYVVFMGPEDDDEQLQFDYMFDGDIIKGVAVHRSTNGWMDVYPREKMAFAALAFAGAQYHIGFWTNERGHMAEKLLNADFESFSYQLGGMDIVCDLKYGGSVEMIDGATHFGADDGMAGLGNEGSGDNWIQLDFTIS